MTPRPGIGHGTIKTETLDRNSLARSSIDTEQVSQKVIPSHIRHSKQVTGKKRPPMGPTTSKTRRVNSKEATSSQKKNSLGHYELSIIIIVISRVALNEENFQIQK